MEGSIFQGQTREIYCDFIWKNDEVNIKDVDFHQQLCYYASGADTTLTAKSDVLGQLLQVFDRWSI